MPPGPAHNPQRFAATMMAMTFAAPGGTSAIPEHARPGALTIPH